MAEFPTFEPMPYPDSIGAYMEFHNQVPDYRPEDFDGRVIGLSLGARSTSSGEALWR